MAVPIIKWAGGKRQLLTEINKKIPENFNTYYEPFFGGGAVFFDLEPENAVINDFNSQLINVYKKIKTSPKKIISYLEKYQKEYNIIEKKEEKLEFYYKKREEFNAFIKSNTFSSESASLFIFLNKAGYNGLYRVNKDGFFNVPSAHRKTLNLFDYDNILDVSKKLKKCEIKCGDFFKACKNVGPRDLVFFDSPYYDTFDTYQAGGFSEGDHRRLAQLFDELSNRGAFIILTNNNCDFIKNLYANYNIKEVEVKRMINSDSSKRTGSEVIITNF